MIDRPQRAQKLSFQTLGLRSSLLVFACLRARLLFRARRSMGLVGFLASVPSLGPHPAMSGSSGIRPDPRPANIERANSLRAVNLVAADRQEITLESPQAPPLPCRTSEPRPCEIRSPDPTRSSPISTTGCRTPVSLLACMTETTRVSRRNRRKNRVGLDITARRDWHQLDFEAELAELARAAPRPTCAQSRWQGHASRSVRAVTHQSRAERVVTLGRAAREDDLLGLSDRGASATCPRARSTASLAL